MANDKEVVKKPFIFTITTNNNGRLVNGNTFTIPLSAERETEEVEDEESEESEGSTSAESEDEDNIEIINYLDGLLNGHETSDEDQSTDVVLNSEAFNGDIVNDEEHVEVEEEHSNRGAINGYANNEKQIGNEHSNHEAINGVNTNDEKEGPVNNQTEEEEEDEEDTSWVQFCVVWRRTKFDFNVPILTSKDNIYKDARLEYVSGVKRLNSESLSSSSKSIRLDFSSDSDSTYSTCSYNSNVLEYNNNDLMEMNMKTNGVRAFNSFKMPVVPICQTPKEDDAMSIFAPDDLMDELEERPRTTIPPPTFTQPQPSLAQQHSEPLRRKFSQHRICHHYKKCRFMNNCKFQHDFPPPLINAFGTGSLDDFKHFFGQLPVNRLHSMLIKHLFSLIIRNNTKPDRKHILFKVIEFLFYFKDFLSKDEVLRETLSALESIHVPLDNAVQEILNVYGNTYPVLINMLRAILIDREDFAAHYITLDKVILLSQKLETCDSNAILTKINRYDNNSEIIFWFDRLISLGHIDKNKLDPTAYSIIEQKISMFQRKRDLPDRIVKKMSYAIRNSAVNEFVELLFECRDDPKTEQLVRNIYSYLDSYDYVSQFAALFQRAIFQLESRNLFHTKIKILVESIAYSMLTMFQEEEARVVTYFIKKFFIHPNNLKHITFINKDCASFDMTKHQLYFIQILININNFDDAFLLLSNNKILTTCSTTQQHQVILEGFVNGASRQSFQTHKNIVHHFLQHSDSLNSFQLEVQNYYNAYITRLFDLNLLQQARMEYTTTIKDHYKKLNPQNLRKAIVLLYQYIKREEIFQLYSHGIAIEIYPQSNVIFNTMCFYDTMSSAEIEINVKYYIKSMLDLTLMPSDVLIDVISCDITDNEINKYTSDSLPFDVRLGEQLQKLCLPLILKEQKYYINKDKLKLLLEKERRKREK